MEKSEEEGGYLFTRGWTQFCELEILVFSYVGNSTYATTAFEKDSNFLVAKNASFQVLLNKYHRNKLYLRTGFVEACGLIDKKRVRLEYPGGQSAQVVLNSSCTSNGNLMKYLGLEWMGFWKANDLTIDKMYSFEFIPSKKVIRVEPVGGGGGRGGATES